MPNIKTIIASGQPVSRIEFETFEELEAYFVQFCIGQPGMKSKVIGKVLLMWAKPTEVQL